MTISNRDVIALDRYANALEEFRKAAASNAGKMLRVERVALEKAAGGKKKLDRAETILAEAERARDEIMSEASRKVAALNTAARARIELANDELAGKERKYAERLTVADERDEEFAAAMIDLVESETKVKDREEEAHSRARHIHVREDEVSNREDAATMREAEVEARARRMTDAAA